MPFVDLLLSHPYPTIFLLPILTIVTLRPLLSLISHIRYARSTGLNYLIYPFEIDAPIIVFLLTQPKIHSLIRRTCSPAWQDYIWLMAYNTHWWVKDRMSQRYGDIFLAVSPCSMCLFASNTDAITAILGDPVRFPKMLDGYDDFRLYGPNILSVIPLPPIPRKILTLADRGHAMGAPPQIRCSGICGT
jgi:hypothetical protein